MPRLKIKLYVTIIISL